MIMLTRSLERTFNPSRYTGYESTHARLPLNIILPIGQVSVQFH